MGTSTLASDRAAWREAVQEIAEKAKAKLPECSGRVDAAVKLVLAGDVALQADGTARVASRSNGAVTYFVANGHCQCKDYPKAPHQFCSHRLSAAIARRASEMTPHDGLQSDANASHRLPASDAIALERPAEPPSQPPAPLPEAPVSIVRRIGDGEECYQCNQECWDFLYTPTLSLPAMA
jgi:hypothetical protein